MRFDVSELRDLAGDLKRGAAKVEAAAPVVVKKTAFDVEATAKVLAPVDTGNLENSITTSIDGLSAEISPTAHYGDYVEAGTKNEDGSQRMAAQPYMVPALEIHAGSFETAMGKVGEKIL